ncbi:MAG: dockerin type I repeat-containing protein, partial [Prevotella sp.]|nr:dockerin type I repeat-containing protein [Prevotella sp.]
EPIYYSSSKEEVATVVEETGEVTLTGVEGTAVITATFNGNDNYSPATASYTIIVSVPAQPTDDVFELAEQITEGDEIIIVGEHKIAANEEAGTEESIDYYGLSTNQKDNNRGAVTVTYNNDGTSQGNSKLQVITIEGNDEGWYFNVGNGYLYAASSSANWLRTEAEADDNAKATITIGEDQADIIFQGTNTHNVLKFNFNNGSPLFSCYTSSSSQLPVKIYRKKAALLGDANNDGIVNVTDVMLVVRYSGGGEVLYINLKNADINKDGQVNITDAMAILPLAI